MLRAKKKKRKGKREKRVKRKCINERETLTYEQEILDNNRQLARLRSRNEELEEEVKIAKEKLIKLEQDRSDVIAYLKRNLEERIEESRELSDRLAALEELRKDELAAYKKKEEAMAQEFRTMENNLTAEVKLAAGKLNSLEDWRIARLDLMQRFENQEKEMAELAEKHKETLYEAEKSVIIGKAMMKTEMAEHLDQLAEALRKATNLRVAETTHRAIRENIALNNELDKILRICRELEITSKEYKEKERNLRLQCQLYETESKITLKTVIKQRNLIHKLVDDLRTIIGRSTKANISATKCEQLEKTLQNIRHQMSLMEQQIKLLKRYIIKIRSEKEQLQSKYRETEEELEALTNLLNRAKSCIKKALQLEGDMSDENICDDHLKHQLVSSLWEILETENITSILKHTPSQIENLKFVFEEGCLGLMEAPKRKREYSADKEKEYVEEFVEATELSDYLNERVPSCLLSDISSNIESPKESTTNQ